MLHHIGWRGMTSTHGQGGLAMGRDTNGPMAMDAHKRRRAMARRVITTAMSGLHSTLPDAAPFGGTHGACIFGVDRIVVGGAKPQLCKPHRRLCLIRHKFSFR